MVTLGYILVFSLLGVLLILVVIAGLAVTGNIKAMKFLARNGVAVFTKNPLKDYELLTYINKDGIGWIHVPNTCYAPVMNFCSGYYKNHNFLKKPNFYGEIYLSSSDNVKKLQTIANPSDNTFKDLSVITGSAHGNGNNLRHANFSQLTKYNELSSRRNNVQIVDNGVIRNFRYVCTIDISLDGFKDIEIKSREQFLDIMQKMGGVRPKELENDVILLRRTVDIESLIIVLEEIK